MEAQIIAQIKSQIEVIKTFDRSRLYPTGAQVVLWNSFSQPAIKEFVDDTLDILYLLPNIIHLEKYGYQVLVNIRDTLTNIINAYNGYIGVATNAITSENHSAVNYIESLTSTLKASSLYVDLKFDLKNESKELRSALIFAKELNQNKSAYDSSIAVFKEALKDKNKFTAAIVNEKGVLYNEAARENSIFYLQRFTVLDIKPTNWFKKYISTYIHFSGSFWHLFASIFFASLAFYIVIDFVNLSKSFKELSTGFVILRLSSLIIPSYFSYFFSSQYINSKRLYEFYKFKGIALMTLSQFYTLYPNHQTQVIEKALNVLFSEFHENQHGVSQKELLSFATEIAKSRLG